MNPSTELWEKDAIVASAPTLPPAQSLPSILPGRYDVDSEVMSAQDERSDIRPIADEETLPLSTSAVVDMLEQTNVPEQLVISKDLLYEDADFRRRAKRGDVVVYEDS